MKKIYLILFIVPAVVFQARAQCHNTYFDYKEGTEIKMTSYNKKGKVEAENVLTYTEFKTSGKTTEVKVHMQGLDKKGKETMQTDYTMTCENNVIQFDLTYYMAGSMNGMEDMEYEITSENLEYPSVLKEGQTLNDASMEFRTVNSPMPFVLTMKMDNRKVVGKETITTPAGTFECFKISYDTHNTVGAVTVNSASIVYLAPKVGVVKIEHYRPNGNSMGYELLTSFKE